MRKIHFLLAFLLTFAVCSTAGTLTDTSPVLVDTKTAVQSIDAKTPAAPANQAKQDTGNATLSSILAAQATAANQSTLITSLGSPFQAGGSIGNTAFGVNNGAGAAAVNVQDGGNSLTVDNPSDGTAISAATMPSGGAGFMGWLSAIYNQLTQTLNVAATQSGAWTTRLTDGAATADISTLPSPRGAAGLVVSPQQQKLFLASFSKVQSGVDTDYFTIVRSGTGQTTNQSAGNLVVTAGTTANAETILRSQASFSGSLLTRARTTLSQRITNNNFYVELVDVIGDDLALTVNSATSITVTIPSNPFTAANVGQFMSVGNIQGVATTAVPGRWAIASVSGNDVTFTVAGWPVSGTGTVSLFGWNYYQLLYTSTVVTNAAYDAQRNGWNSGNTTATINTTAAPGHMAILANNDGTAYLADQLVASVAGTLQTTQRASRVENTPDPTTTLYLQLRAVNGTTAPASNTTWTVGSVSVENYSAQSVVINEVKAQGTGSVLPVTVSNTPPVTVSSGTVTTVTTLTTLANGQTAHSTASTGSPLRVGGRTKTTHDTTLVSGDASDIPVTTGQAVITYPHAAPELSWQYAAAAGGITNTTTAVTIKAAGAAGIRNYLTGCQVYSTPLGTATELAIRDGAAGAVIWRTHVPTTGFINGLDISFRQPLRGTAATLLELVTLTASGTGSVYANCQGFEAP